MAKPRVKHLRAKHKDVAPKFPVSEDNPFGIDTSPEVIEREPDTASDLVRSASVAPNR